MSERRNSVEARWEPAFQRFVETGEADDAFLQYLDEHPAAQRAVEDAFKQQAAAFADLAQLLPDDDRQGKRLEPALSRRFAARIQELIVDAGAATLPAVAILGGLLLYWNQSAEAERLPTVALSLDLVRRVLRPTFAVAVAAVVLALPLARFQLGRRLQHSLGALVGGLLIGGAMFSYVRESIRVEEQRQLTAVALASDTFSLDMLRSLQERVETGLFPRNATGSGPLVVTRETSAPGAKEARYRATAKGIPGSLEAEVGVDGGQIYYQYGNKRELRRELLLGTVAEVSDEAFSIVDPQGVKQELTSPREMAVQKATTVAVLVDRKSRAALAVRELNATGKTLAKTIDAEPNRKPSPIKE